MIQKSIHLLGYASDIAGAYPGSAQGPDQLQQSSYLSAAKLLVQWHGILHSPSSFNNRREVVAELCHLLALQVKQLCEEKKFFLVVGGDHSSAIGTWQGAAAAQSGDLGLIWIDAHMDSHTPETSISGNIHGMPMACLLGYGDPALTQVLPHRFLKPQHVCLIGVRSYETGEAALLKKLGVRIFAMEEVKQRGLTAVMQEAMQIVAKNTVGFGISLDIDALDPHEAPGTGVAVPDGLHCDELLSALQCVLQDQPKWLGAEIAEFDPTRDNDYQTEKFIVRLLTFFSGYVK